MPIAFFAILICMVIKRKVAYYEKVFTCVVIRNFLITMWTFRGDNRRTRIRKPVQYTILFNVNFF